MVIKAHVKLSMCGVVILLEAVRLFGGPVISSFTPTFGASNDPGFITISGSGFSNTKLVVKFNGVQDPSAGATTATTIQAHVPAGATNGSNPIFVSVNDVGTYSADDFTVIGPGPFMLDFSPKIGSSETTVTINGGHFSTPLTVKFNGVTATKVGVPSSTLIIVTNPPPGVTSGPITVTNSAGTYTSTSNFYVPPVITGLSPAAGRAGTNVLITGTNFLGATAVRFNGLDAASFNVLSNQAIQAAVPANAATGIIRVIAPAGSAFSGSNFVVQPTITGFSPGFGPIGTSVTILGANLNVGSPVVKFNGVTASTGSPTFNQITANVPGGATTGPITVTTTDGEATSASNFYLPARITSFVPNNSGPGTTITITGENFVGASAVNFSGAPAAAFFVTNNTTIGAIVPFGVVSGPISVTTPAGTTNSSSLFYAPPLISVFYPTHGLPGTNVAITGQNFLDASVVSFNGSNAVFSVLNNNVITTTVPDGAQTGPVTVVAPAGTNTTAVEFVLDYTADVRVTVTDSPDPVLVTSNLTYSIVVLNNGPFSAPGVTFSDTLPESVILKSATTTAGSLNTDVNPITANLGQINSGNSVTVTLVVAPQTLGTITNLASVASLYDDPSPSNNAAINTTTVEPLPLLSIQLAAPGTVRISWAAVLTNYTLQFKPLLSTTNFWSNVTTAPQTIGNERFVTETNLGAMKYYRLRD